MLPISEFHYRRRVTFPETDATGIVHFSNFFRYVEEAETAMWRVSGLLPAMMAGDHWWPRVQASFDYKRPLRFEDEFDVHLRIAGRTGKTLTYAATITRAGELIAAGQLTVICAVKKPDGTLKAVDMPPDVAARFAIAEEGTRSDQ